MRGVFIVGAPRSGTTLVQQILTSNREVYSPPETHYFKFMLRLDARRHFDNFYIPEKRYTKFLDFCEMHKLLIIPSHVSGPPRNARSAIKLFSEIMESNATQSGKSVWVEKTPAHLFYIGKIEKRLTNCKYIHIIRDPRNTLASLVSVGLRYPSKWPGYNNIDHSIQEIESTYRESNLYVKKSNHLVVSLDSLLLNPERETVRMLEFAELSASNVDVDAYLSLSSSNTISRSDEKWKQGYGVGINKSNKEKYDELFSEREKDYIEKKLAAANNFYRGLLNSI